MQKETVFALAIVLASSYLIAAESPTASRYRMDHRPGTSASLWFGDRNLWTCHLASDGGYPYFHPLATADGTVLTALAPPDHTWHRGLWFSWKYINGVNYWEWAAKTPGVPEGITQRVGEESVRQDNEGTTVAMKLQYVHQGKTVLSEVREIKIGLARYDGSYALDWRGVFMAGDNEVILDRTPVQQKTPWGGYGGLSFRAVQTIREITILDSEGRTAKQGHGKPARWMDYSGVVDRQKGTVAGVTIFDHPGNPRHPTPWYVETHGIQYFGPAMVFHEPFKLPAGNRFTLKYRVLVHSGRGERASLENEYKSFRVTDP